LQAGVVLHASFVAVVGRTSVAALPPRPPACWWTTPSGTRGRGLDVCWASPHIFYFKPLLFCKLRGMYRFRQIEARVGRKAHPRAHCLVAGLFKSMRPSCVFLDWNGLGQLAVSFHCDSHSFRWERASPTSSAPFISFFSCFVFGLVGCSGSAMHGCWHCTCVGEMRCSFVPVF
jgi:hypothetical protein